jgi:hypothetical protein
MKLIRKIFGNKSKYCEDFGHDLQWHDRRIERYPTTEMRCVLVAIDVTANICKHCGFVAGYKEKENGNRNHFQSVTMPDRLWKEIKEKGYIFK